MPASLLLTGLVLAGPPGEPLQLRWEAPPECPSGEEVRQRVVEAIGDPEEPREVLLAQGRIEATDGGRWALELTLEGSGARRLDAGSCRELTDAAVLILAIAIDPEAIERLGERQSETVESAAGRVPEPEPESESEAESEPEPEPEPAAAPVVREPTVERPAPSGVHFDVQLAGGAAFGILPGPGGWFAAGVGARGRLWRVELEGTYTTPSVQASSTNPDVRGRFQLWSIGVRAGPVIPVGDVSFPIHAGVEAGGMYGEGEGEGFASTNASTAPWVGFIGGATALWRPQTVDRLGVGLRLEGIAALTRPRFVTPESGLVYEARPGGARIAVVFTIRLR